ncbi:DUF6065 family protein [Polyangium aurulentum]|uniref:DUF6065 family protein n=1 Tax=Polyangium aurulentum TaxID=2567896 RepID=UPI0010ADE0FD|nr:DUF6065 family protein [Polyangium aurulentum]UQA55827.1 hypothetical protein E8A73_031425 [Polyangium aurulentum]
MSDSPPDQPDSAGLPFIAHHVSEGTPPAIVPAPHARAWMSDTRDAFANRCLPLLIANQAGWLVLSSSAVRARWDGGDALGNLEVEHTDGEPPFLAKSHFGHGILTFTLPYLFRTPQGFNLLVRGPANHPKDGASPLEGIVETDWCTATFTMNWKLTRPGLWVTFARGEPIAMLVPQRRGELEAFAPEIRGMYDDPDVARSYAAWRESRAQFLEELPTPESPANRKGWQKHYVHGQGPDGITAPEHQRKLALRTFLDRNKKR